jgi:hypothetical protein
VTPEAGSVSRTVHSILLSIPSTPWFAFVGTRQNQAECENCLAEYLSRCHSTTASVQWVSAWKDAGAIARELDDQAALWAAEEGLRRRALLAIQALTRTEALGDALNELSEAGYEHVRPQYPDEELVRVASGSALWTASGAITWALVADGLGREGDPFTAKLRIFELGHWPLGLRRGSYVIF